MMMTTGYKVVSLLKMIFMLSLGVLPMLLLGISIYTKAFFGMVVIAVVVFGGIHFFMLRSSEPRKIDDSDKCPYKVEV